MKPGFWVFVLLTIVAFIIYFCGQGESIPNQSEVRNKGVILLMDRDFLFVKGELNPEAEKSVDSFLNDEVKSIVELLENLEDNQDLASEVRFECKIYVLGSIQDQYKSICSIVLSQDHKEIVKQKTNASEVIVGKMLEQFNESAREFYNEFSSNDATVKIMASSFQVAKTVSEYCNRNMQPEVLYISDMLEIDYNEGQYHFIYPSPNNGYSPIIRRATSELEEPNSQVSVEIANARAALNCEAHLLPKIQIRKPYYRKPEISNNGISESDVNKFWIAYFSKLGFDVTFSSL